jgi:hypothetical protein
VAITDEEAVAVSHGRRARTRYLRSVRGLGATRRARHVLDAAMELATSGGHDTDRVAYARQEVARLRGS